MTTYNIKRRDKDLLRSAFKKITDSCDNMSEQQFCLFVKRLSGKVKALKESDGESSKIIFKYLDKNSSGSVSFEEFKDWWRRDAPEKYKYFMGKNNELISKAYALYMSHANNGGMKEEEFSEMMSELGIEYTEDDFYYLDKNKDGVLSFGEFCDWLNWF